MRRCSQRQYPCLAAVIGVTDVVPFNMGMTQAAGSLTPLKVAAGAVLIAARPATT
ncbi:MAG: hypothetical protein WBW01_00980 [Terriglobales bacterium]